jgi:hypothetical protein
MLIVKYLIKGGVVGRKLRGKPWFPYFSTVTTSYIETSSNYSFS